MDSLTASPAASSPVEMREVVRAIEDDSRVEAVAIFGSVARREAGPRSDIDVLVVHDGPLPDDLADCVPEKVAIAFYNASRLAALPTRSPLFAVHLANESALVRDQTGLLTRVLRSVGPLNGPTVSRLAASTLRRFDDLLAQPRGLHLDPHAAGAELYALAKQGAMLLGAADGVYEFNRHRALRRAYARVALTRTDRARIDRLEELWHAARVRDDDPPAPNDLEGAAAAVRRLLVR